MTTALESFIRDMPKAELHLHIEGSLEPEMMASLAKRNQVTLPYADVAAIRAAYDFSNLQDFLDLYYQGMSVLQTEQDFFDLTAAYLEKCAAENVRHVEIFFDPQGHTERGVAFETVLNGITAALDEAEQKHGITHRLIMCLLRHLSEQDGLVALEQGLAHADRIHGLGLDSSEVGHPPEKFQRAFDKARGAGWKLVAHAGEEGPPAYVWSTIDGLKVDRIDHGNRALEDEALVATIVERGLALTVCPLSNLKLCVVDDLKDHPLKRMLQKGLKATVNSDDPAYFGGYVTDNYLKTAEAVDLTAEEVLVLAKNGFEAAFLPEEVVAAHVAELEACYATHFGSD